MGKFIAFIIAIVVVGFLFLALLGSGEKQMAQAEQKSPADKMAENIVYHDRLVSEINRSLGTHDYKKVCEDLAYILIDPTPVDQKNMRKMRHLRATYCAGDMWSTVDH